MAEKRAKTKETPKMLEARTRYYAMGATRSLAKVRDEMVAAGHSGNPAAVLRQLEYWSTTHGWVDWVKQQEADKLAAVQELEQSILFNGTRELHRRYGKDADTVRAARTDELLAVLGHVRPKDANINHGGTIVVRIVGADVESI